MANICRLTRLIEKENPEKHYFKFYEEITPFVPRCGAKNVTKGCVNLYGACGNCGMGTNSIGLLPWDRISLCHNGFVDLITGYKEKCKNDEKLKEHSIDTVLFTRTDKMRDTNCTIEEFEEYQKILLSYSNPNTTFQTTQLVSEIMILAKNGMIDAKYASLKNACEAAEFISSATSYCIRDNIGTSGSTIVAPIGLLKLLLNGAKEYITYENTNLD